MTVTRTYLIDGDTEAWKRLAEAHRTVTLEGMRARAEEARRQSPPEVEPGSPQADHESAEQFFARRAAEELWARDEGGECE